MKSIETFCGIKVDLFETDIGKYYLPDGNDQDAVLAHMKDGRIFDKWVYDKAKKFTKPGTSILDLGANFGQMSMEFSKIVGDQGLVYCFECFPPSVDLIHMSLEANEITNVKVISNAVYEKSGIDFFYKNPESQQYICFGSYGVSPKLEDSKYKVKTIAIDDMNIEEPISFMKVDVQGADLHAMRGAKKTILKNKMPIVYEYEEILSEEFGVALADYKEFVEEIGYQETDHYISNYLIEPKQ